MSVTPLRHIWLCADDYGIAPGVNTAIRDLIARGRINATSVMVVAPSFNRFEAQALAALNTAQPRAAIGLHLTLTAPFRKLSASERPLDGAFPPLANYLTLRTGPDRTSLAAEIGAQLDAFREHFSRMPDFIDGHQHVQLFPQVSRVLLDIANTKAPGAWLRQCGRTAPLLMRLRNSKALFLDVLSYRFRHLAARLGVRTNPGFAGAYTFDDRADFALLFPRFLEALPDGGVVMCHPGFVDDELRRLDPLTTLREREYTYLAGDGFPKALGDQGVALA